MYCKVFYTLMLHSIVLADGAALQKGETRGKGAYEFNRATSEYALYSQATREHWENLADEYIENAMAKSHIAERHFAKNLIIFVGDGMGATTATAARVYKGQRIEGVIGEEHLLSFDKFPYTALVKTYNVDKQVPDSAGTATAMFTGVKTRYKMIGLDGRNELGRYVENIYNSGKLTSIMDWAQEAKKMTGIVTTTRITHATPAATYAHSLHRDWECDSLIPTKFRKKVKDIARQLVEDAPGKNLNVVLGGGQEQFGMQDQPPNTKTVCPRTDNTNLTELWLQLHDNKLSHFVTDEESLLNVPDDAEHVFGLFSWGHLPYELVRKNVDPKVPSLSTMTEKAIKILSKSPEGFVLMVEGGLIDVAHHDSMARLSMEEVSEFDNAIAKAVELTNYETLILVTSDHSHSFTMNGYPSRGNDIMGFGNDSMTYLTLSYANGPGFNYHYQTENKTNTGYPWRNLSNDHTRLSNPYYQHMSSFYLKDDTHGGEDVPIYANGPLSYLFSGVMEQSFVAHLISYVLCIGPQAHKNQYCKSLPNRESSPSDKPHSNIVLLLFLVYLVKHLR